MRAWLIVASSLPFICGCKGGGSNASPQAPASAAADGATFKVGQAVVTADIQDEVRNVLRNAQPQFRPCYTNALAKQPGLKGLVKTKFAVTREGKADAVEASGVDPAVAECISAVIKTLVFPRPDTDDVSVYVPFSMRP